MGPDTSDCRRRPGRARTLWLHGARVLVVDNYDSFVYNLVQELGELGADPVVYRNDAISVAGIKAEAPDAILISPGPGRPDDAASPWSGRHLGRRDPILGVCLGHQCIGQVFGGRIVSAPTLMHGRPRRSTQRHGDLRGLPEPFVATRYHSSSSPPNRSRPCSGDRHQHRRRHHGSAPRRMAIEGVQFHPESILTPSGPSLLANFLDSLARQHRSNAADHFGRLLSCRCPAVATWPGVEVVVVVDALLQTVMVTVAPFWTLVPALGFWAVTLPF